MKHQIALLNCLKLAVASSLIVACDDEGGTRPGPAVGLDASADVIADGPAGEVATGTCPVMMDLPARIEANLSVGPGCVVAGKTDIRNGAVLTIAPGTTVLMKSGAHFDVGAFGGAGTLISVGTPAQPVKFTSISASPLAADWQCVFLGSGAVDSDIQYTTFEYGGALCTVTGSNDNLATVIVSGGIRGISHSAITDSGSHGIKIANNAGIRAFANNRFARNANPSIWVAQNEIITLGVPNQFEDTDDFIRVDSTFSAERSGTWQNHPVPYRATNIRIRGESQITIAAGAKIQMTGGTVDVFNANMIAQGTAEQPVVFTSANAAPQPGDWGCIWYSSVEGTPSLTNTIIEYAGNGQGCSGANYKVALVTPPGSMIAATTIRNIAGGGVRMNVPCDMVGPLCSAITFSMLTAPALQCGGTGTPTACP